MTQWTGLTLETLVRMRRGSSGFRAVECSVRTPVQHPDTAWTLARPVLSETSPLVSLTQQPGPWLVLVCEMCSWAPCGAREQPPSDVWDQDQRSPRAGNLHRLEGEALLTSFVVSATGLVTCARLCVQS